MKLFMETGEAEDGTMTQKAVYTEIQKLATKEDLLDYLPVSKESELATKTELQDYIPVSKENEFATKNELITRAEKPIIITTTIPTIGWNGENIKTVTIEVEDIKNTDVPIVDVKLSNEEDEQKLKILEAWDLIIKITTNDGTIIVEAIDIPEVEIPINMLIIR